MRWDETRNIIRLLQLKRLIWIKPSVEFVIREYAMEDGAISTPILYNPNAGIGRTACATYSVHQRCLVLRVRLPADRSSKFSCPSSLGNAKLVEIYLKDQDRATGSPATLAVAHAARSSPFLPCAARAYSRLCHVDATGQAHSTLFLVLIALFELY